jgi:hypothetical protein
MVLYGDMSKCFLVMKDATWDSALDNNKELFEYKMMSSMHAKFLAKTI